MDKVFFTFVSLVDVAGIAACMWLQLQCQTIGKHWYLRTGVGVFSVGLLMQLFRNAQFLYSGLSPTDADLPLWALKDIGGFMVASWFAYMLILRPEYLGKLISSLLGHTVAVVDKPEPKKPAAKKAPAKTVAVKTVAAKTGSVKKPVRRQT